MSKRKNDLRLHVSYPHRWGDGKTHISGGTYRDTLCAFHVHGTRRLGNINQVTCKHCLRIAGQIVDRLT